MWLTALSKVTLFGFGNSSVQYNPRSCLRIFFHQGVLANF